MRPWRAMALFFACACAAAMPGCERESRSFPQPASAANAAVTMTRQRPGVGAQPLPASAQQNLYEDRAYDVSEGKKLYGAYNCVGCHANGGGGIGPPLMDADWIYGAEPQNVYSTIVEGRPNGMPSFRGKIPEYQVWQLVAYVRSLSGQLPKDVAPTRDDHMFMKWPESQKEREHPQQKPEPKAKDQR